MDKSKLAVSTYNKIAGMYTEKYFDDQSDSHFIDIFLSYMPEGARILDVGCGPGSFTRYTKDKGFIVEGIDLSSEMIRIAKEKNPKSIFRIMDMRKLEYEKDSFDGIFAGYSLIHILSKELPDVLKDFRRVLKLSGKMLVVVYQGESDRIIDEPLKDGEKMFVNFFSSERLLKFIHDAGFKVTFQKQTSSLEDSDSMSDSVIYMIAEK